MLNIFKNAEKSQAFILGLMYKIITTEKLAKSGKFEKFIQHDRASDFLEF